VPGSVARTRVREVVDERPVPPLLEFAAAYSRRLLLVAAAAVVFGYVVVQLSGVVLPVLVAGLVTALLYPPAAWLRRRGWPRILATVAVMAAALALVVGLLSFVGPAAASQFDELVDGARSGLAQVTALLTEGPLGISEAEIQERVGAAIDQVRQNLGGLAGRVVSGALIAVNLFAGLLLVLFLVFFMVKDGDRIAEWFLHLPRAEWRADARELGRRACEVIVVYMRGVVTVAVIDAVLIGAGLLAIGVPLVLPLAIVTFMGAFFPLIGAIASGALAVLVALVTNGFVDAALVLGLVVVVQQLEGNVLYPLLVGRSLSLHPLAILLALSAGTVLAGVVGALFAVPIAAVISTSGSYLHARGRRQREEDAALRQRSVEGVPSRAPS